MLNIHEIKKACTHGTVFHADDVFATALIKTLNPDVDVERVIKVPEDTTGCLVYDIGEGEYDHHQKDKARRPIEDGYYFDEEGRMQMIPYCSFGLLWRDLGHELCPSEKAWKKVDRDLVLPIDKADNGVSRSTLTGAIASFNPAWNSKEDRENCFWDAVIVAQRILMNYVNDANAEVEAEETVLNSKVVNKTLVLDQYVPWQDIVIEQMPEILYVCFPSMRGGYNLQTVPDAPGSFKGRKGFPEKWLGNPDKSLGMTFCHPGNFLLATETLEQALECARIAVAA